MIKKSGSGYTLYSKDGSKRLGGPYATRAEAEHREKQVTYFKNKAAGDPVPTGKHNAEKEPYGSVEYADPGHQSDGVKRYPIDTEEHIRAAWNYIHQSKNAGKYSPSQAASIKSKIVSAWKSKVDSKGPPSAGGKNNEASARIDYLGVQAFSAPKTEEGFRTEQLHGRNYMVVPVTALVEGVIQGVTASEPELALASEFGKFPQGWNGRPVVMDHPEMIVDNQAFKVSANTPQILEKYQFGFLFNSKMEGNALKTEAWIDTQRAAHLNDNTRWVMGRLASMSPGESLEVSTGLFTGSEFHTGKWEGKDYTAVWSGVVPDHLAFLPEGALGACSVADGCGAGAGYQTLRANCNSIACQCGGSGACSCGGTRMAQSNKPTDEQEDDAPEAEKEEKNEAVAKSKIAQPAVLKAMQSIKSKIDSLFRTQTSAGLDVPDGGGVGDSPGDPGLASLKPPLEPPEASSDFFMRMVSEPYRPAPQDVGDPEKRDMTTTGQDSDYNAGSMTSFLDEIEEGEDTEQNIERDPTDKTKPKKGSAETLPSKKLGTMDIEDYEAAPPAPPFTEDDSIALFDNAAISADHQETNAMNAQEARKFLANFGHTEAALKSIEDAKVLELARGVAKTIQDHIKKVGAGTKAKKRQGSMMDEDNTDIDGNPDDDMTGKKAAGGKGEQDPPLATLEGLLAQASPDLRESIESGVRMHAARKDQLIQSLLKTNRCQFKAQELRRFSIDFLENLAALAAVPQDYSGLNINRQPRLQRRESTGFAPKPPGLMVLKGGKNGNGNGNGNGKKKNGTTASDGEDEEDDFPHTYAKSAYEAGGPGYDGNRDGEDEGEYDGTGADSEGVDVKKTKKRVMTSD